MRSVIYEISVVPPNISEQFGANGFYNFGRMAFTYGRTPPPGFGAITYTGPTHWLEHKSGILIPEFPDAIFLEWLLKPGVILNWAVDAAVSSAGVGAAINGTVQSLLTNRRTHLH